MIEETYRAFLVDRLGLDRVPQSSGSLYAHLCGTHDLLHGWGNPTAVCLAGLFHSIYGTWQYPEQSFPIERRGEIVAMIGAEAEHLAYLFCVTERPKDLLANAAASTAVIKDHVAEELIEIPHVQMRSLLEIEAANLIDVGVPRPEVVDRLLMADVSAEAKRALRVHRDRFAGAP